MSKLEQLSLIGASEFCVRRVFEMFEDGQQVYPEVQKYAFSVCTDEEKVKLITIAIEKGVWLQEDLLIWTLYNDSKFEQSPAAGSKEQPAQSALKLLQAYQKAHASMPWPRRFISQAIRQDAKYLYHLAPMELSIEDQKYIINRPDMIDYFNVLRKKYYLQFDCQVEKQLVAMKDFSKLLSYVELAQSMTEEAFVQFLDECNPTSKQVAELLEKVYNGNLSQCAKLCKSSITKLMCYHNEDIYRMVVGSGTILDRDSQALLFASPNAAQLLKVYVNRTNNLLDKSLQAKALEVLLNAQQEEKDRELLETMLNNTLQGEISSEFIAALVKLPEEILDMIRWDCYIIKNNTELWISFLSSPNSASALRRYLHLVTKVNPEIVRAALEQPNAVELISILDGRGHNFPVDIIYMMQRSPYIEDIKGIASERLQKALTAVL